MNPITNAKIISTDTDPKSYHATAGGIRGQPDHVMSNSELKRFADCPQKWFLGGGDMEETESTRWGTLVDALALTPTRFELDFAETPETYPDAKTGAEKPWNWNANYCKDWRDDQGDRIIVKPDQKREAQAAVDRLLADPEIGPLLGFCSRQVMAIGEYHDKDTGLVVPIKTMIDIVPDIKAPFYGKCLADLKTTEKASVRGWARKVFLWGLHVQAALYLDVYTAATGEDRSDFLHVISESIKPYETNRVLLTSGSDLDFVELGREFYVNALRFYCKCLKTGHWPGYAEMSDQQIHGWAIVQPEAWMIGGDTVKRFVLPAGTHIGEDEDNETDENDIMP